MTLQIVFNSKHNFIYWIYNNMNSGLILGERLSCFRRREVAARKSLPARKTSKIAKFERMIK